MRPCLCPRLSRRRAFPALLGALPARHSGAAFGDAIPNSDAYFGPTW
jgi:hypothetical protein